MFFRLFVKTEIKFISTHASLFMKDHFAQYYTLFFSHNLLNTNIIDLPETNQITDLFETLAVRNNKKIISFSVTNEKRHTESGTL